ncbi:unnamed protein product, partial [Mesorhabditis spiculigera]
MPCVLFRILWEGLVGIPLSHLFGYNKGPWLANSTQHIFGGFASFYTAAWIYGIFVLWDKPWLWDVKECWIGYPFHEIPRSVWWYYTLEATFYYSLLLGAFFDVRRSDFWQLIFHHVVTLGLLSASWAINFVRVGTLVLVSHDIADVFLEGGKLPDYQIFNPLQVPYVPRLIIIMLVALFLLHIFWTYIIGKIVVRTIQEGEAADVRSDSEDEAEEQEVRRKRLTKTKQQTKKED